MQVFTGNHSQCKITLIHLCQLYLADLFFTGSLAVEMYYTYQTPVKTKVNINFSILRFFPLLYSQVENKQSGSKAGPCAPVIDELL